MTSFTNLQFAVNENTRLSVSNWKTASGTTHAVALLRKSGGKWVVDHETAAEFVSDKRDPEDAAYRATDYGYHLVVKELGYEPERFFKNHFIG